MSFRVRHIAFDRARVDDWARNDEQHTNWPVVYVIDGARRRRTPALYVGETTSAHKRLRQHLASSKTQEGLESIRVVIDDTYNKSVCLDLESHLIRWFHGDGRFHILNGNDGLTDARYYDREIYRESFRDVFEALRAEGLFSRSIPQIENTDLFKLSPFKALTDDQAIAVEDIIDGLLTDLQNPEARSTLVVQGDPGTGKTIIAIFLMKLLVDIRDFDDHDDIEPNSMFAELFTPENRDLLSELKMALVIPQQSLRESVRKVFKKTPRLDPKMVLTPFQVGESDAVYDLILVDETHRLNQRANQASGVQNKKFGVINERLFGTDDPRYTQLDWVKARSRHRLLLVDGAQSVRPHDLSPVVLAAELAAARNSHRHYPLTTQMRVKAGSDYVEYIRGLLRGESPQRPDLGDYDLRFFDDLSEMRRAIRERDAEVGLSRLVAGYAWDWKSHPKRDPSAFDIEIDGERLRWNSTDKDWINSAGSLEEVGSIHTVQGYDLNYAGVIIGPDLRLSESGEIVADREAYRDKKGKEDTGHLKGAFSDDDLLVFIRNIYGVLLTRGMLGTYVYVCDSRLRIVFRELLAHPGRI
ncbi:DNA/RNA helicase domain-containing protein [Microbacterium sp.]|uniref:DNA/RNA helicase domain-containing protein n=1 Tax=Microbacterium sp. TaxID=51671 RepID=UPI0028121EEF|nr:DNA/RNA helicase domain-containing protein [Microbacterium sp.]